MNQALFWLYLINAVLLIDHEIDSAYWKEWRLFAWLFSGEDTSCDDAAGHCGFILSHLPLLALILWGLVEVSKVTLAGLIISIILSLGGIFAFTIHMFLIKKGRPEFRAWVSVGILSVMLLVSIAQLALSLMILLKAE